MTLPRREGREHGAVVPRHLAFPDDCYRDHLKARPAPLIQGEEVTSDVDARIPRVVL